jgi:hypothetical protein
MGHRWPEESSEEKTVRRVLRSRLRQFIRLEEPDWSEPSEPKLVEFDPNTGEPVNRFEESDSKAWSTVERAKELLPTLASRSTRGGFIALAIDVLRACGCSVQAAAECVCELYPIVGFSHEAPDPDTVETYYYKRIPNEFKRIDAAGRRRILVRLSDLAGKIEDQNRK